MLLGICSNQYLHFFGIEILSDAGVVFLVGLWFFFAVVLKKKKKQSLRIPVMPH